MGPPSPPMSATCWCRRCTPCIIVILENLATHRNVDAAVALRQAGCCFLFLPPYSPDRNPIEQAFPKRKAHLRRIGARPFAYLFETLGDICDMFSPQKCWAYFNAAVYGAGRFRNAFAMSYDSEWRRVLAGAFAVQI